MSKIDTQDDEGKSPKKPDIEVRFDVTETVEKKFRHVYAQYADKGHARDVAEQDASALEKAVDTFKNLLKQSGVETNSKKKEAFNIELMKPHSSVGLPVAMAEAIGVPTLVGSLHERTDPTQQNNPMPGIIAGSAFAGVGVAALIIKTARDLSGRTVKRFYQGKQLGSLAVDPHHENPEACKVVDGYEQHFNDSLRSMPVNHQNLEMITAAFGRMNEEIMVSQAAGTTLDTNKLYKDFLDYVDKHADHMTPTEQKISATETPSSGLPYASTKPPVSVGKV